MITCWLQRRRIERALDSTSDLPEAARAHAASCPRCREYAEQRQSLVRRLRAEASTHVQPLPAGLNARLLGRLAAEHERSTSLTRKPEQYTSARRQSGTPSVWTLLTRPAVAVSMALAAAVLLSLWMNFKSSAPAPGPSSTTVVENRPASRTLPLAVASETLEALPTKLTEPLELEMRSLLQDARSAAAVLASHFTPTTEPGGR